MPNVIESEIREALNVPREVQLNNADTEAQWESFRRMHLDGSIALVREDAK